MSGVEEAFQKDPVDVRMHAERMARAIENWMAYPYESNWGKLNDALKAYRADVPRIEGT